MVLLKELYDVYIKVRIFWNELTEQKLFFFLFPTICIFYFCKNVNPHLYILFLANQSMT